MTDVLALVQDKSRQTRERILALVADLDDGQLGWRPTDRAHSIGFTLWHIARADDNVLADLTGRAELEWQRGGYAARWGHPERGTGTGWDDERAAALPLPPKDELLGYVRRVFDGLDAAVVAIDAASVARPVTKSRFIGADSTMVEVVFVCVTHENRHLGEMEYIKGLLRLRGSATN